MQELPALEEYTQQLSLREMAGVGVGVGVEGVSTHVPHGYMGTPHGSPDGRQFRGRGHVQLLPWASKQAEPDQGEILTPGVGVNSIQVGPGEQRVRETFHMRRDREVEAERGRAYGNAGEEFGCAETLEVDTTGFLVQSFAIPCFSTDCDHQVWLPNSQL